jgi:CrcB protein
MRVTTGAEVLLVAAGGAAGCVARHLVGLALPGASAGFPWGTLLVNVAGSFALGVVLGALPPGAAGRLLFGTGFCGGFTTFSTFAAEAVALADRGLAGRAGGYAAASVALGAAAAAAGVAAGRAVAR